MVSSIVWRQSVRVYKGHYCEVVTCCCHYEVVSLGWFFYIENSLLASGDTFAVVYKRYYWTVVQSEITSHFVLLASENAVYFKRTGTAYNVDFFYK